jgi:hypothetical protein
VAIPNLAGTRWPALDWPEAAFEEISMPLGIARLRRFPQSDFAGAHPAYLVRSTDKRSLATTSWGCRFAGVTIRTDGTRFMLEYQLGLDQAVQAPALVMVVMVVL